MMLKSGIVNELHTYKGYNAFRVAVSDAFYREGMNLEPTQLILQVGIDANTRRLGKPDEIVGWWFARYNGSSFTEDHSPLQSLIRAYSMSPGL